MITVTGYRHSVQLSTEAKRDAVNTIDTVFAEDIGKFPDLNIAESLNRIPGVQLTIDVNGEGLNVSIRGLGSSFTLTTMNGAPITTASIGLNNQNQNREVDLNLFPTEFFTQLTVEKTPKASTIEGGIAGTVDMRSARPFDNPGTHLTYSAQTSYNNIASDYSPRGSLIGSWTNDAGTFGALFGLAIDRGKIGVHGWESVGWTNPGLTYNQCGLTPPTGTPATNQPAACNVNGGGNWRIPDNVPNNSAAIGAGLTPGAPIDNNFLLSHNPGLTTNQISEALIPRLGRPVDMTGDRDRDAYLGSLEWRPNDSMHFYLDTIFSKAHRTNDRIDMDLVGRNGSMIPLDMQVDANNVVTKATFTNAQFFLEARPYTEDVKYYNVNPGGEFIFNDSLKLNAQVDIGRSWMFRESPTVLVNSPFTTIQYSNTGGDFPTWTTGGLNLNDPNAGWTWAGGRVNINNEKRHREQGCARRPAVGRRQEEPHLRRRLRRGSAHDHGLRQQPGMAEPRLRRRRASRSAESAVHRWPGFGDSAGFAGVLPAAGTVRLHHSRLQALRERLELCRIARQRADIGLCEYGRDHRRVRREERRIFRRGQRRVRYRRTSPARQRRRALRAYRPGDERHRDRRWHDATGHARPDVPQVFAVVQYILDRGRRRRPALLGFAHDDATESEQHAAEHELQRSFGTAGLAGQSVPHAVHGAEGYVGLSLFNKRISGYTYQGTNTIPFNQLGIPFTSLNPTQQLAITQRGGPDSATVTVSQQVNAPDNVNIRGWEANWVQPLDRLIEGLGFSANYTHIQTTVEGSGPQAVAVAQNLYGIAPKLWNTTLYWERGVMSARLSYTWTAAFQTAGNNQNGIPYATLNGDSRGQLDFSASYTLDMVASKPQLTFNAINITDQKLRSIFYWPNATNDFYDPGRTYLFGIRGSFNL